MVPQHRWIWLLYFACLWIAQTAAKEVRVVCYYTNWSVYRPGSAKFSPQNINPYLCTHLVYAFGGFTKENTLKPFDKYQDIEKGGYAKFTGLKTYNKNLKTMLAIGGWNEGSSRFSPMVANAERRKELVKNVVKFLRQNHFDGLDLDWEYPSFRDGGKSRDRDNYAQLVQELREEFERESGKTGRTRLLLTMAVPAGIEYINKGYDVPKLMKYLDWMNILSYDYHSAFEPSVNHHAPLYPLEEDNEYNYDTDLNIDHTIKHYLKAGAISEKLVLGIPTYGRSYTLFNPDANEIGDPADGPGEMGDATRENGYLAYYEICESVKSNGWTVVQPNEDAMGPYAFKDDQWVGYDDESIARKKSQYVAEHNLGGIMFWAIDNDDFRGDCHNKSYPIIEAAKEALVEALGLTEDNVISKRTKPTKTRGRQRATPRPTESSAAKERTQNSGGRQSSDKPSSRRRLVNKVRGNTNNNDVQTSSNAQKSKRRRRPTTTKSTPINEEPNYKESGSSLVVTTPSYKTPEPPTTPDPGGDFKCEDEGFYPHPRDCKKYFWCLSGPSELGIIAHQFTCPAGLYFNKAAASCDYTQNVLCNMKMNKHTTPTPKVRTTAEESTPETAKTTKRPAPKITAATSRTTFYSSTTTEAPEYYDEYEYEDDVEDAEANETPDSEDPRVIKELLELIKKAGGIDELEKQLNFKGDSTVSDPTSGSTTQSSISKKLYERVLLKTKLSDSINARKNSVRYNTINRNSRGPQSEGNTNDEATASDKSRSRNSRPQYSTISRQRASKVTDEDDFEDDEDEKSEDAPAEGPKYVTLKRSRPTTSTTESEQEDSLTKLGESRGTTSTSKSPYVTLKRTRPTTIAADDTTTEGKSLRRRPTTIGDEADDESNGEIDSTTHNYPTIKRSRPTTSKYEEIVRGTTGSLATEAEISEAASPFSTSTPDTNSITNASEDITNPIVTNINEDITSQNTEKQNADVISTTQKIDIKPPKLSEPRPFSFNTNVRSTTVKTTTTEKVTATSKVSYKPLLRSRPVEAPDSNQNLDVNNHSDTNNKVDTVYTRGRTRGSSRFKVPEITTERIYFDGGGAAASGGAYEDVERHYRPDLSSHISDLSSLTAVDFSLKGFNGSPRRSRPRVTPNSTPSTLTEKPDEELKTVSRTLPLARKPLEGVTFGGRRRSTFASTTGTTPASVAPLAPRRTFAPIRRTFTTAATRTSSTTESTDDAEPEDEDIQTEANDSLVKFKRPKYSSEGNEALLKSRRPVLVQANATVEDSSDKQRNETKSVNTTGSSIKFKRPLFPKSSTELPEVVEDDHLIPLKDLEDIKTEANDSLVKFKRPKYNSERNEALLKSRRPVLVQANATVEDSLVKLKSANTSESLIKFKRPVFPKSSAALSEVVEDDHLISLKATNESSAETDSPSIEIKRPISLQSAHESSTETDSSSIETKRPISLKSSDESEEIIDSSSAENSSLIKNTTLESSNGDYSIKTNRTRLLQGNEDSLITIINQNDRTIKIRRPIASKSTNETSEDENSQQTDSDSVVKIRHPISEGPTIPKMNRKIIRRLRVTTPSTTTNAETSDSTEIKVPNANPELNNVRHPPLPYARKLRPVTPNTAENVVNSTEDDDDDELDEEENIKLSESNILENSDLNRVNSNSINDANQKGHRKVIKRIKFTTQPTDTKFTEPESSTLIFSEDESNSTTTAQSAVLRTRKIIRKLPTGTTEANDSGRTKIIKRLKPKSSTTISDDSEESIEDDVIESSSTQAQRFTTTTESLKNRIKPFRPNKKIPAAKESLEKLIKPFPNRRLKLFTRRPPTASTTTTTTESPETTIDPLSNADIIKFHSSNDSTDALIAVKRLQVYTRLTIDESNKDDEDSSVANDDFKDKRIRLYPLENSSEEINDESETTENTPNDDDKSKDKAKRLQLYTRSSTTHEELIDESLEANGSTTQKASTDDDNQYITTVTEQDENDDGKSKRLELYTRSSTTEGIPTEDTSPEVIERTTTKSRLNLYKRPSTTGYDTLVFTTTTTPDDEDKSKRLEFYSRSSTTEDIPIEDTSPEVIERTTAKSRLNLYTRPSTTGYDTLVFTTSDDNLASTTVDPLTPNSENNFTLSTTDTSGKSNLTDNNNTSASANKDADALLAKRLKLYTRPPTTEKRITSTEEIIEDLFNTEENTETATDADIETTIMPNIELELEVQSSKSADDDEIVTTESDVGTTEFDNTETTEVTTFEPKPSTPVYVNKIYRIAGARPKLDLKSRLGLKYTTEAYSFSSSSRPSTRFEARSRRPHRFRSSTTEPNRIIEVPDTDDIGYGTVKPFKKLFVSTDRPKFKFNSEGVRVHTDDEDGEYEEYGDAAVRPVTSSTTGKYYINTNSFNRNQHFKPTESVKVFEEDEEEVVDEDEDEDFPDSEEEEYEDDEEAVSRKPYVATSKQPFLGITNNSGKTRKSNNPHDSTTKRTKNSSTRAYRRFTSTTPLAITQNLTDINFEALNQRNKQLFNKTRKMNTPPPGTSVDTLDDVNATETINITSLYDVNVLETFNATSLYDVNATETFNATSLYEVNATETTTDADIYSTESSKLDTTVSDSSSVTSDSSDTAIETTVAGFEATTTIGEQPTVPTTVRTTTTEKPTTFYHIFAETQGTQTTPPTEQLATPYKTDNKIERIIEVNRIVNINGENDTQKMNTMLDHIGVVNRVTVIKIFENGSETIETDPGKPKLAISINGPNILTEVLGLGLSDAISREERKFEIYGDSKVSNSLNQQYSDVLNAKHSDSVPNQIIIESKSSVKTNTPKPLFSNEVSTIALEGLFMTQSATKPEQSTTEYEELLDTENSNYVNVKILNQGSSRNAVFIVRPEEEVTMKADVVEISRPVTADLIKIAPIAVSFQKRIPNIK